ncbi:MAG: hypothetical protein P1U42_12065 [Phycisphaerales bacterium]|nr:hypothetical protein [Phycisphaerales bacterium]
MSDKQCNIDSRGKAVRLIFGLILVLLAGVIALVTVVWNVNGAWPWVASVGLFAFGAFALYEGWSGWCALRAMGVKTWL